MASDFDASPNPKTKCPDCIVCQGCSKSRCSLCKQGGHKRPSDLGQRFTYGEYLAWKKGRTCPPGDGNPGSDPRP